MGSKKKLRRFRENEGFENVIQPSRQEVLEGKFKWRGKWCELFKNNHPVVLELGCGKGEYTVGLARQNPQKNYIGVDIKGARLWRGAKTATEEGLDNVIFLRTQIELIENLFEKNEVSEIWLTFPDPQIKFKRTKHRLTNQEFLEKYKSVIKENGEIHLKTDSEFLHGYTLGLLKGLGHEIVYANHNVYRNEGSPPDVLNIQTHYENQFLEMGKPITYIQFRLS